MKFPQTLRIGLPVLVAALCWRQPAAQEVGAQQPAALQDPVATGYREHFAIAENRGSAALWQLLKKLNTRASLMTIVAHPDDEDGGMLAYESRGVGARVALFTLNRGEGGLNIMSSDLWDALGLVRTQELLAAGRYYGATQYWGSEVDFGFSKTREEALQQWGHDRVLYDVVRAVRQYRPLVLTSSFVGGVTDGHGQHQVAGEMAQEAFTAAADPKVFPDQITKLGLQPWQPLKVYAHVPFARVTGQGIYDYATQKWTPVRFYDYTTKQWTDGVPATNLTLPEGDYDATLGETYAQIYAQGVGQQRSQHSGPDVPAVGPRDSFYHRYASRVPAQPTEQSFFDGVDTSLAGIATLAPARADVAFLQRGLAKIQLDVDAASKLYAASAPEKTAPALVDGVKDCEALMAEVAAHGDAANPNGRIDLHGYIHDELAAKAQMFRDALALALGLQLQAVAVPGPSGEPVLNVIPGEQVKVLLNASSLAAGVAVSGPAIPSCVPDAGAGSNAVARPGSNARPGATARPNAAPNAAGRPGRNSVQGLSPPCTLTIAKNAPLVRPRFSRPNVEQPYYDLDLPKPTDWIWALTGDGVRSAATASATFTYMDVPLTLQVPLLAAYYVAGQGTLFEPLDVLPAISITLDASAGAVPLHSSAFRLTALIHSNVKGDAAGTARLQLPPGWTSVPAAVDFHLRTAGEEQNAVFAVTPMRLAAKTYNLTAVAAYGGRDYTGGYTTVGYPGLRRSYYFRPASFRAVGVDVRVAPALRVGYVMGTGDHVPLSLDFLGVHAQLLSAQDLASGDLGGYDAIVLGVRAYAARPELATSNSRLLDYARAGGVVIVQYNTAEYNHGFGPYPYNMGNRAENVVDETDKVTLLAPQSPVLNWPNKITSADFNGWVEERGHSFLHDWDPRYEALTETHDPGQDPQKGGMLYARYGKGEYVYVAYALYRQMPEGVPGAYRIFANLLSLGKNPLVK